MSDNTERFTGRAEVYDRYRQRYPAEAVVRLLREWCGLAPEWTVADVGAGTGMLSEIFLESGNRVLAVEPNAQMRRACERLAEAWPKLEVINATAEVTSIPSASVEMVAAGRAFHWFDKDRALAEFRRVLKPGGWLVLVSAGRAHDANPQAVAFERLLTECGMGYSSERYGARVHDRTEGIFSGEVHQAEIAGEQQFDWDAFRGNVMSLSAVPREGDVGYERFQDALRVYFGDYSVDGVLTMATKSRVTAGRI
jgi:ubiquinone/menaquinone biosynthesis C-methylase UbiE